MSKIAAVTGGSSGIGLAAAEALARRGCRVYELSRRGAEDRPSITHLTADVSDEAAVRAALGEIIAREGRIDLLVCNAGMGISGAVEFTELSDAKALMDVNFFGVVNAARAALPHLRESRGRIVCTSSVAAVLPIPFQTYYSASKAAVSAFVLALGNEVRPLGVTVCAVLPGDTGTGFTGARRKSRAGDDVYSGRIARSVAVMERDEQNGMTAAAVGGLVARVSLKKRVKPFYTAGLKYKLFVLLARVLPPRITNAIVGRLY
jgi:NAD(P)-dependent dehydrogenase (short-subunit alcohol dehydrogenase family)